MPAFVLLDTEVSRINYDGLLGHADPGKHFSLFQLMLHSNNSITFGASNEKKKTNPTNQTTLQEVFPLTGKKKQSREYTLSKQKEQWQMISPGQTKNCPATSSDEFLFSLKGSATFPRHWNHQLTSEKPRMECSRENWNLRKRCERRGFTRKDEATSYAHWVKIHLWNFILISSWFAHLILPKTPWFPTAFNQNWHNYKRVLESLGSFWYQSPPTVKCSPGLWL